MSLTINIFRYSDNEPQAGDSPQALHPEMRTFSQKFANFHQK